MAWDWSHTNEAYFNARENLRTLDPSILCEIFAEWYDVEPDSREVFDQAKYERGLEKAKALPNDVLADIIWTRMEVQRTCDSYGGYMAWCCPYGCEPHKVSFESKSNE